MVNKKTKSSHRQKLGLSGGFIMILLILWAVIILYPLFWMIMSSFKSYDEIYSNVWSLPGQWLISNYATAWEKGISSYFVNSVIVTATTIAGVVIIASLCAYGLSRYKSRGIDIALMLCTAGMMVNPQVCLIPLYVLLQTIGIHNTRLALILLYITFRLPLSVLLIRSYFLSIPKEIEESAIIDGCSDLGIYRMIYMPMSKPIIFTTIMLTAYYAWNEFLFAIIFIDSDRLKTIPSGLMNFRDALQTNWGVLLAGMVISAIPMIILLTALQKHLVRGMSEGALKG